MGGYQPWFSLRSYAMDAVGPNHVTGYQVSDQNRTYPLPELTKPGMHGVGIYWIDKRLPRPTGMPVASRLPSCAIRQEPFCCAKTPTASRLPATSGLVFASARRANRQCLYQIDPTAKPQDPNSAIGVNEGGLLYAAHWNRFNYLFHDGHVAALSMQQTIGSGTLTAPRGMWTVVTGD